MLATHVESTTLATVVYDAAAHLLWLEFRSHAVYCYFGVPAAVHHALLDADSRVLTSTDTFGTASLTKESPPYPSPLRLPRVELWNGFNDPFRVIPPSVRTLTPKLRDAKNV